MSVNVTVNGSTYTIPQTSESGWGDNVTTWIQAISSSTLQKSGGSFPLTAEVDFGATFGLKAPYYKSATSNISAAGALRLANTDSLSWRNIGNTADLALKPNTGTDGLLQYNGVDIVNVSGAQTLSSKTIDATTNTLSNISNASIASGAAIAYSKLALTGSIANADIAGAAAIAYAKLALAGSIVNADIATAAAIAYSKLALTGSIVNADLSAAAAIAYSKLALTNGIVNADINSAAAIALSKLAGLTTSRVLVSDGSGVISPSSVTSTTLGFLDATSSIQTQLNAKQGTGSYITALTGDVSASGPGSAAATISGLLRSKLALGTANHVVINDGTGALSSEAQLAISRGGTGQSTANAALNALLPTQTANSGKVLKTDGSNTSWGAAGGAGGVNFVGLDTSWSATSTDDRDFEGSVGNWVAYADAAGTSPVDMTGGAPNTAMARTVTAGEVINGAASGRMTITTGATRQGEGVSVVANIPPAYRTSNCTISIPFKLVSGSITQGDLKVFVYDVTNSQLITPFNNDIVGSQGTIVSTFAPSSTTAQIRVGIHVARGTATGAVTLSFDDVTVGPATAALGLAGENFRDRSGDVTFTSEWGTPTGKAYWARRIGDTLEVEGYIIPGTTTASNASIPLPAGLAIDTAKYSATNNTSLIGEGHRDSATTDQSNHIFVDTATTGYVFFGRDTVAASSKFAKIATSTYMASGDLITFKFKVRIAGWDSNVTIAQSSTFKISSYLANGSRVTGSAPTALGQYRSYLRAASASTFSETNGAPTAAPASGNGIALYYNTWAAGDASGQPSKYEIYCGKNKNVKVNYYLSAGYTGFVDTTPAWTATNGSYGFYSSYDPTTGILTIVKNTFANATNYAGIDATGATAVSTVPIYAEITVSENALAVGVQANQSEVEVWGNNGFGSTATNTRRWSNISTNTGTAITYADVGAGTGGGAFTINEDGLYAMTASDRMAAAADFGITKNSTNLAASPLSLAASQILAVTTTPASEVTAAVPATTRLRAGDIIRVQSSGGTSSATTAAQRFRITKVSN